MKKIIVLLTIISFLVIGRNYSTTVYLGSRPGVAGLRGYVGEWIDYSQYGPLDPYFCLVDLQKPLDNECENYPFPKHFFVPVSPNIYPHHRGLL